MMKNNVHPAAGFANPPVRDVMSMRLAEVAERAKAAGVRPSEFIADALAEFEASK